MKKWSFILLSSLVAGTTLLGACTKQETPQPNSDNEGVAGKPVTFTVFAPFFSERTPDLPNNDFTKYIEEKQNIKINWELVSTQGQRQKKQLMFASGDYPEVIFHENHAEEGLTRAEQIQYGKDGILLPLNDLIDKYGPNIKQAFEQTPYLKKGVTAPDGNIYALPQFSECYHCNYSQKFWINTKWLKKLGLQMPTTTDEFYEVLKAFKEKDPNGNGKQDEIPLSGSTNGWRANVDGFLMNAFTFSDSTSPNTESTFMQVNNGKVELAAVKPEWKEGLGYIQKLYMEKLIDPQVFTQNRDALKQKGMPSDTTESILGVVAGGFYGDFVTVDDPRWRDYDAVPPLKGPKGVQLTPFYGGVNDGFFAITKKANKAQQIAAIKLVDYLFTEEGMTRSYYGEEGVLAWEKPSPGEKDLLGNPAKYKKKVFTNGQKPPANKAWDQLGPFYQPAAYRLSWAAGEDMYTALGNELRLYKETKEKYDGKQPKEQIPRGMYMDAQNIQEYSQLAVQINSNIQENMVRFITGNKDLDKDWDAYVKGLNDIGLDKYMKIVQVAYDNYKK